MRGAHGPQVGRFWGCCTRCGGSSILRPGSQVTTPAHEGSRPLPDVSRCLELSRHLGHCSLQTGAMLTPTSLQGLNGPCHLVSESVQPSGRTWPPCLWVSPPNSSLQRPHGIDRCQSPAELGAPEGEVPSWVFPASLGCGTPRSSPGPLVVPPAHTCPPRTRHVPRAGSASTSCCPTPSPCSLGALRGHGAVQW